MNDIREEIWLEFHKFYEAGRRGDSYDGLPQTNKIINKVLDAVDEAVEEEKLVESTGSEADIAYGNAIIDVLWAINKLRGEK